MIKIKHIPGKHCASTGICNIVNFHGIKYSEAMCFGIGAGLGIWYMETSDNYQSRLIHVRSEDIEKQFFTRIGYPFKWNKYQDPEKSETDLCRTLDKGVPAIIQTDIYYLPYFKTKTHFPGHVITVWAYNKKEKIFYISDTEKIETLKVDFLNMKKARFCSQGFFHVKGNLFGPEKINKPKNLNDIIKKAILFNSKKLFISKKKSMGIMALETWLKEIHSWHNFKDHQWTSRFAYQVIEKRGTGGGGFRFLYRDFLREASQYVPEIKDLNLVEKMNRTAIAWQNLAFSLKKASEKSNPDFNEVYSHINEVYELESLYHTSAIKIDIL